MHKAPLWAVVAAACPGACLAQGLFVSVGGGLSDVSVDESFRFDSAESSDDNWANEVSLGHMFESKVSIEGSITRGVSMDWLVGFDSFEFKDDRLMAGYAFDVGERFAIVPAVGLSFWNLDAADNRLLRAPTEVRELSGEDWVWRLRGEVRFSERWRAYFSYTRGEHDFGSVTLPSIGVKIQF